MNALMFFAFRATHVFVAALWIGSSVFDPGVIATHAGMAFGIGGVAGVLASIGGGGASAAAQSTSAPSRSRSC